jgi:ABC-type branched-subunit amino acid transport system substrate-binding protein
MTTEGTREPTERMTIETYVIGDTLYSRVEAPGEPTGWIRTETPPDFWEAMQGMSGLQEDSLEGAEINFLGTEEIDGVDCYILEIILTDEAFLDAMMAQQQLGDANGGDSFESMLLLGLMAQAMDTSMKQWVTKDTYLLRRVEMAMEMDLSSVGIYMGIETTSNMRNHNEPVDIQLPEYSTAPLKIGQLNSFTGVLSDFGTAHRDAAQLAIDHINQAGGVMGEPATIVARDTATIPVQGVDAAHALVNEDKVVAIVGALSSGVTIAVAQSVTVPNGILQITASSTNPAITVLEDDDFLFRTAVSDAAQGTVLGRLAVELGYESASALYINNAYGQGLAEAFEEAFEAEGGTIQELVPHEMVQPTYASELTRATAGDPDVLLALSYPESAEVYLREAIEGGYIDTFLFCDGTKSPDMNEAVGVEYLEGTYGTAAGTPLTPVRQAFQDAFEASFGVLPPLPYLDTTYDAVVLIALAAEKAGTTTDSAAIRDVLRDVANPPGEVVGPGVDGIKRALELIADGEDINYEGAGGSQDFDDNGDVFSTIEIWKITGGEIISTGRYELP